MHYRYFSYALACLTVMNTLLWHFLAETWLISLALSTGLYLSWSLFYGYHSKNLLNPADWISFGRWFIFLIFLCFLTVNGQTSWLAVVLMSLILASDGLDGWVARRWHYSSEHGAVLDMEVDHMITSLLVAISVLLIGISSWFLLLNLWRPLYLLLTSSTRAQKRFHSSKASILRAKVICVVSLILLIVNISPLFSLAQKNIFSLINFTLISYSFTVDLLAHLEKKPKLSSTSKN